MEAIARGGDDLVAKLVPGGVRGLAHLSDDEVLANTRRLVGKSNQVFAALLLHLAEVEARGIHRKRLCATLYTYCIYELRFSEDAAARRSSAARLVKQFPALFDAVAAGELHLTGLLMIGPHLTTENHVDVLARAKFRTKKELGRLVRELDPLPEVPDSIEPLGPALKLATNNPSWEMTVAALCGPERELPLGERPRDWVNDVSGDERSVEHGYQHDHPVPKSENQMAEAALSEQAPSRLKPLPKDLPPPPQRYEMRFTTLEEHVELVERAKALLCREQPGTGLSELHLQAMRLFVAALEKQKLGAQATKAPRRRGAALERGQSSRYVPTAERRLVFERDGGRCTYTDDNGDRCRETHYLEIHHIKAFAKGGATVAANLTLHCRAHNALLAEADFGKDLIALKRDRSQHESFAAQRRER